MSGREKRKAPGTQNEERPGDRQMLSLDLQQDLPRLLDSSFWSLHPPSVVSWPLAHLHDT